jgi:polyhydroxybutyrate depolymerase
VDPLVPVDFDPASPTPLVIFLHGYGASGAANNLLFALSDEVDPRGFVLLLPNGTVDEEGSQFWNGTDRCCDHFNTGVDDVAYLSSLIEEAQARYTISHVGVMGHSNGAYMTHRFACDRANVVDAFASLAGATWQDASQCEPDATVAALEMHGTEDPDVLIDGEPGDDERPAYPGSVETIARWAALNGCDPTPQAGENQDFSRDVAGAETEVTRHPTCNEGGTAELWTIVDEGHVPAFNDAWRTALFDHLLGE